MRCSAGAARRGASGSPSSCPPSTRAPKRLGFPSSHRLTTRAELHVVGRAGKRFRTEHLEVRALASRLHHPRVGLIVPLHRHTAIDRNRLKRRLREIIRTDWLPVLPPLDIVVRARSEAYAADFAALRGELGRLTPALVRLGAAGA